MPTALLRLARLIGWLAIAGSVGLVIIITLYQSIAELALGSVSWPREVLWRSLGTTILISALAALLSIVAALPAAFALVCAQTRWQRAMMLLITLLPLITMPSVFAYAWLLVGTSSHPFVRTLTALTHWNDPAWAPVHAAIAMANWLWPIPAWMIASAFRYGAADAYGLALLDVRRWRAFWRGAFPLLRGPLFASFSIVFILSALDTLIAPLLGAPGIWASEVLAQSAAAMAQAQPAGFLFWFCWPILGLVGMVLLLACPALCRVVAAGDSADILSSSHSCFNVRRWRLSVVFVVVMTTLPLLVFTVALANGRYAPIESFAKAWHVVISAGLPTLLVAVIAATLSLFAALALVQNPRPAGVTRWFSQAGVVASIICAVMPAQLISVCLVSFFSNPWISPPDRWNIYDNTPLVWVLAMLARFSFIPICVGAVLNRYLPESLEHQAAVDGADQLESFARVRVPLLLSGLIAASVVVLCLSLSEVAASQGVQPPQWSHGSLAVYVDAQMHYGRHDETIALSVLMFMPPLIAGIPLAILGSVARRNTCSISVP